MRLPMRRRITSVSMSLSRLLLFIAVLAVDSLPARAAEPAQAEIYDLPDEPAPAGEIDRLVFARLAALGIAPARVCSDATFVRRAYLDVTGTLPTATEAKDFLADRRADKRRRLIDRLLELPAYAEYWTMRWSDVLRIKAEFPINLWPNAAQAYHRWLFAAIRENKPYDQFACELLTASGSNFRVGPANFYRAMQSRDASAIARVVALAFMGTRVDRWPPAKLAEFSRLFAAVGYKSTQEWKEEIVFFDADKIATPTSVALPSWNPTTRSGTVAKNASTPSPSNGNIGLDRRTLRISPECDPRELFAAWLTAPENPWFARAMANRTWAWLLGRGIVEEPDDLRADNPPSNPELLDYLTRQFVAAHFDVKALLREILNSTTYQLSSLPRSEHPDAEANFACYAARRLDAEVLIDALNAITGTTEKYSSPIPEPFTFIPDDQRSIALPDGSITSSFLEMFGRPGRDTGFQSERNNRITASQRLHLLNSTHVQRKLEQGPALQRLFRTGRLSREILAELYFTILSRPPTDDERQLIADYARTTNARSAAIDVTWALINSTEFLYRH